MTRDAEGGAAVNLVPGPEPRDIYKECAVPLAEHLRTLLTTSKADDAEWWLELLDNDIPRSLTKRPVMILPYGGTREAYFKYTRQWLKENHPEVFPKEGDKDFRERMREVNLRVSFLVAPMLEIVHRKAAGAVKVMKWLQDCARFAAKGNQPLFWKTPSGFIVRHFYGQVKTRRVETKIDGQTYRFAERVVTEDLDVAEQLTGIPPNFVHSQDASALMETIQLSRKAGIVSISTIHDNVGAPAADMDAIFATVREAFVRTHASDAVDIDGKGYSVLEAFRAACVMVYAGHIAKEERMALPDALVRADQTLPPMLPLGDLDIEDVLSSDYFFA